MCQPWRGGDSADVANTAWCHADWRRSGALSWRKPKPAADNLLSPPMSQRPINELLCAPEFLRLISAAEIQLP